MVELHEVNVHTGSPARKCAKSSKQYITPYQSNQLIQILDQYPTSSEAIQWECSSHGIPKQWTGLQRWCHVQCFILLHPSTACLRSVSAAVGSPFFMVFQGAQVIDQMARLKGCHACHEGRVWKSWSIKRTSPPGMILWSLTVRTMSRAFLNQFHV